MIAGMPYSLAFLRGCAERFVMSVHYLVTCFGKSAELPSPLLSECAKAMHEKDGWSAWDLISTFLLLEFWSKSLS